MNPWIEIPLRLLAAAFAFGLPGTLAACWIEPRWSWPMRLGVGVVLSVLIVPLTAFVAAWVLATSITPGLTLGVAAGWSLLCALPLVRTWRRGRD
jgi:predicted Na+-dependent transporter